MSDDAFDRDTAEFESHRSRLFGLAYRMLGSAEEAEDVVQDVFLRWDGADRATIENPAAWLTTATTNLCLNRLTSARARRERYVGPWLPEPVLTEGGALDPQDAAEQRESISMAMLLLLERLTPTERAVFVLREAFAHSHHEIADILGISTVNARQLYRRATADLEGDRARFQPSAATRMRLVERFLAAARDGAVEELERMLAADVVSWGDGGGKATAARRPVRGRQRVARLFDGFATKYLDHVRVELAEVNGEPAVLGWASEALLGVLVVESSEDTITAVRAVSNPDKLEHLRRQLMSRSAGPSGS